MDYLKDLYSYLIEVIEIIFDLLLNFLFIAVPHFFLENHIIIISCIFSLPILFLWNYILTQLTFKHEVSTFGKLNSFFPINKEQKKTLSSVLLRVNAQSDSWYITDSSAIDNVTSKRKINLIDVQRIIYAIQEITFSDLYKIDQNTHKIFELLLGELIYLEESLMEKAKYKKIHYKIIREIDASFRYIKYSTFAQILTALATLALTIITYLSIF